MESISQTTAGSLTRPCVKCKAQEAALDSRSQAVCRDCFVKFISTKCVKQVGILGKETKVSHTTTRRYVLSLSKGVSSTVLLHLLNENVEFQLARARAAPFELTVVFVDPSCLYSPSSNPSPDTLDRFRQRYPRFTFQSVPLTAALALPSIDWTALPKLDKTLPPDARIRAFFNALPSAASRADLLRLFTRHILLSSARGVDAHALMLGHSTTALAELTLSETAKGRGFSLPWQINDGTVTFATHSPSSTTKPYSKDAAAAAAPDTTSSKLLVYHPLRDILRKELTIYTTLTTPPLTDLVDSATAIPVDTAVVSHKDLSIEEVMFRYFAEVEESYPSVVANVARTTGKLVRLLNNNSNDGADHQEGCGMCGMPLDEQGDERWRGELGMENGHDGGEEGKLCYGCERSIRG